ncbi:MAG: class I SAM-dependent methyltransferase [Anaerolineae bacterium]
MQGPTVMTILAGWRGEPVSEQPDPYARAVRYYDSENADRTEDIPFYIDLVERFGGPLLYAGCGTGRLAPPLLHSFPDLAITGVDLSLPMLEGARKRLASLGPRAARVTWLHGDLVDLALGQQFGLAIFPYNGFMHLLTQERQIAALEALARHLAPGGGLVIDISSPIELFCHDELPHLVLERTFTDRETGHQVMQQSLVSVDRAAQIMAVTWVYDRIGEGGQLFRDVIPVELRLTFAPELRLLLARAGLNRVELYGDYDFNPYDETSSYLLAVATQGGADE